MHTKWFVGHTQNINELLAKQNDIHGPMEIQFDFSLQTTSQFGLAAMN